MALEYVRVDHPNQRRVLVDGLDRGVTGDILRVDTGKHRFKLGEPLNYQPSEVERDVHGTNPLAPEIIVFTPK